MYIREDIINRALNESINDFLIEEGFIDGVKRFWKRFVTNPINMYMNSGGNTQWGEKYNSWAEGKGFNICCHYFGMWLKWHRSQVSGRLYNFNSFNGGGDILENQINGHLCKITKNNYGVDMYYDITDKKTYEFVSQVNKDEYYTDSTRTKKEKIDFKVAEDYYKYTLSHCTFDEFKEWVGNRITDFNSKPCQCIGKYIEKYIIENAKNPKALIKYLDINYFMWNYSKLLKDIAEQNNGSSNTLPTPPNNNTAAQDNNMPETNAASPNNNPQTSAA